MNHIKNVPRYQSRTEAVIGEHMKNVQVCGQ